MNWNEYKTLAIRTESVPAIALTTTEVQQLAWNNTNSIRMLHATMGVCTELAELVDGNGVVNFVEEAGDVLWYLAIADDVIGFYIDSTTYMDKPPIYWLGELNDAMKRHIFYGKELDIAKMQLAFNNLFIDLENALNKKGFTLALAMEANIRKLEKRYPEKMFTAQAAIHRDVDRELDHIMLNGELVPRVETLLELETDEQLAEVVKERQGQPTVAVSMDDLEIPDLVESAEWAKLVGHNLTASQLSNMAMDLCFARAGSLRAVGAILEARAYDELYRMCGGLGNLLEDTSMYNIWITLGYSTTRHEVLERLERWK